MLLCSGGDATWSLASWDVKADGTVLFSKLLPTQPGHSIRGTMRLVGTHPVDLWEIVSTDVTTGQSVSFQSQQVRWGQLVTLVGTVRCAHGDCAVYRLCAVPGVATYPQKYAELWAFTALEVYDISTCLNFPEGSVTFSNLNITAEGTYYPTWDCQTPSLQCNLAVTSTGPSAVTIAF